MKELERRQRFIDLQEIINSKGYKWIVKDFENRIKEEQDLFLRVESADQRFEKQIILRVLHELKDWAEIEVMRCRSLENMDLKK